MRKLAVLLIFLLVAAATAIVWFGNAPLRLPAQGMVLSVKPGGTLRGVGRQLADARAIVAPEPFWWYSRIVLSSFVLKPGSYRLPAGISVHQVLQKLKAGEPEIAEFQFVEGSRYRDLRRAVAQLKDLRRVAGESDAELLRQLEAPEGHPEGLFFPDTYQVEPGTSDLDLLRRANKAMRQRLAEAWEKRHADLPLKSPYEALILASIIEKETGAAVERPVIASVFYNRLRAGMRLQTDPTVIYGLGEAFDGNLRKRDLTTDTPWNTYTRDGLPPTPIALPGFASLLAATQPAASDFYYFVARGDGTHHFSKSLDEHNRAVRKYQLGQ